MVEERRKPSKEDVDEESFGIGRMLGVVKRRDPQLYEELLSIARSEGQRGSELVYEALQMYRDFKLFSGADPRCVAYAMRMIETMMRRVLEIIAYIQQYLSADFFARQLSMYQALAEQLKLPPVEEKKPMEEKKEIPQSVREKLGNLMVDLSMALIRSLMNIVSSTATRTPTATTPLSTPPSMMEKKPKIVLGEKSSGGGQGEKRTGGASSSSTEAEGGGQRETT
ncbi:MAG: hypothetical protein QW794_05080 [Thermosphaera sp.]